MSSPVGHFSLAFLLGGIFFSTILPRCLDLMAVVFRLCSMQRSRKPQKQQREPPSNRKVEFTTVQRRGLVVFQYAAERLAGRSFQTQMKRALDKALLRVENPNIRSIHIDSFETNPDQTSPPRLIKGRIYDTVNSMVFDSDIVWNNWLETELHIITKRLGLFVPVRVYNCRFKGRVRVILTPLIQEPPGFGACLVSFPRLPKIDLDVDVAGGQVTKAAWLKRELVEAIEGYLAKEMVWPNRNVNPTLRVMQNTTLVSNDQLSKLAETDPFLQTEKRRIEKRRRRAHRFRRGHKDARNTTGERVNGILRPFLTDVMMTNATNLTSSQLDEEAGESKDTIELDDERKQSEDMNPWWNRVFDAW